MANGEIMGRVGLTARPPHSYRNCPAVFTARTIVCAHATTEDPTDCPAPQGVLMAYGSVQSHRLPIRAVYYAEVMMTYAVGCIKVWSAVSRAGKLPRHGHASR